MYGTYDLASSIDLPCSNAKAMSFASTSPVKYIEFAATLAHSDIQSNRKVTKRVSNLNSQEMYDIQH